MDIIREGNYIFHVDREKTIEYYANLTLCECPACRNFYAQIEDTFPTLDKFLQKFGVDFSKPDEIGWYEHGGEIYYPFVAYTVTGKMVPTKKYKLTLLDSLPLSIVIDEGYVPNQQTDDYFLITVYGIELP